MGRDKGFSQWWWVLLGRPKNPPRQRQYCCPADAGSQARGRGPPTKSHELFAARLGSPEHHLLNQVSNTVHACWVNGSMGNCRSASSDLMAQKPGEVRQAARPCGLYLNRWQILSGGSGRNIPLLIPLLMLLPLDLCRRGFTLPPRCQQGGSEPEWQRVNAHFQTAILALPTTPLTATCIDYQKYERKPCVAGGGEAADH